MNILFDKGSSQVQVDLKTNGKRLKVLFDAIDKQGWTHQIGPDRITKDALDGVDVLAILTRHKVNPDQTTFPKDWDFAFTKDELAAISDFHNAGNGILLISNHGPFQAGDVDWTTNDKVLAAKLGITIQPAAYQNPKPPLTMNSTEFSTDPVIVQNILASVTSIVPHNSCAVSGAASVSAIPSGANNTSPIFPDGPAGQSYAVFLAASGGAGPVIVAGNSGIAGSPDTSYPAKGMIDAGSNEQFLLNCLAFLSKA